MWTWAHTHNALNAHNMNLRAMGLVHWCACDRSIPGVLGRGDRCERCAHLLGVPALGHAHPVHSDHHHRLDGLAHRLLLRRHRVRAPTPRTSSHACHSRSTRLTPQAARLSSTSPSFRSCPMAMTRVLSTVFCMSSRSFTPKPTRRPSQVRARAHTSSNTPNTCLLCF